jgi:flagellar hook-length control protein FliK
MTNPIASPNTTAYGRTQRNTPLEPAADRLPALPHARAAGTDPAGFAALLRSSQAAPRLASAVPTLVPTPARSPAPAATAPQPLPQQNGDRTAAARNEQARYEAGRDTAAQTDTTNTGAGRPQTADGEPVDDPAAQLPEAGAAHDPRNRSTDKRAALRGGGTRLQRTGSTGTGADGSAGTDTKIAAADGAAAAPSADTAAAPAALLAWLGAASRSAAAADSSATADGGNGKPAAESAAVGGARRARFLGEPDSASATTGGRTDAATPTLTAAHDTRDAAGLQAIAAQADAALAVETAARGDAGASTLRGADRAVDTLGAAGMAGAAAAAAAAAGPSTGRAEAPQPVTLPTPVGAPDFAQALGLRIGVLAQDGVQHAELHLNPAEMGPVSVQITIEGTQARIDFGADVAETRRAIEAGLPELAGAMRDAGFTLAGGGVSDHARPQGGQSGSADGAGDGPAARRGNMRRIGDAAVTAVSDEAVRRSLRRNQQANGLDLYA